MGLKDITRSEVGRATDEFDRLGREAFLRRYGFGKALRYLLLRDGRRYDSKAVVGAAHGFLPGQEPLGPKDFSGGEGHAVGLLRGLGFTIVDNRSGQQMTPVDELLDRVANLKVNRSSGGPALYQPIVLLWAVARARRGEPRTVSWEETETALGGLLERHGARGERPRPDYPVVALRRAGLWELPDHGDQGLTAHGDSRLRRWFSENQPRGGLSQWVYDILRHSGDARLAVIDVLLCEYFQGIDYEPLLTEIGLYDAEVADAPPAPPPDVVVAAAQYDRLCRIAENREKEQGAGRRAARTTDNPIRSVSARRAVLVRCQGRCENPQCTGQPDDVTAKGEPILEVDHVQDLAQGGRDHPSQMVALCPNCHAIKTRGRTKEVLRASLQDVAERLHGRWSAST
jgi:5-methylcytosine-specific restriction protein A